MAMAVVWVIMVTASVACGAAGGRMAEVSAAALDGARSAVELCVSLAGVLCLWSGFMELLKQCGLEKKLAAMFRPLLGRLLPHASRDAETMAAVEKWAADEFRSTNGQLQWIINEALRKSGRKKKSANASSDKT